MLPVVPEAAEASQQYEALHTALHQFVEATHAEWYNGLEGNFSGALANSLLLQDKNQGGVLVMNFDKQLLKMLQEVCTLIPSFLDAKCSLACCLILDEKGTTACLPCLALLGFAFAQSLAV